MATKQDLLNEINILVSEYLGFKTEIVGFKSQRKEQIEFFAQNMRRAVLYKKLAFEIKPTKHERLYSPLSGEYSAQYLFWAYLTETAHLLYWGLCEKEATEKAYKKVYEE